MLPEEQDVNVESSTTQEVVKEPATDQQEDTIQKSDEGASPVPEGESGEEMVPVHKMYEWKRKAEDLADRLPSIVEEKIKSAFQQYGGNQQQREYTISELEQYAIENPTYRPWVEEQKQQITLKKLASQMDEKIQAQTRRQQEDTLRQQSLKYVMDSYPDAFVKNTQGQIVGWKNDHPLTKEIGSLMRNSKLANDPEGLSAAADIAYARYMRQQNSRTQQTIQQKNAEIKTLQKKTMIEGGGRNNVQSSSAHREAIDRLKKTGTMKDAQAAVAAILGLKGD